jgi:hypothetical protein
MGGGAGGGFGWVSPAPPTHGNHLALLARYRAHRARRSAIRSVQRETEAMMLESGIPVPKLPGWFARMRLWWRSRRKITD